MNFAFHGSGPGLQTPDGCSVELYRNLPYMGELDDIEAELPKHGSVLELGCGTGRLCRRLRQLGLRVTGVDQSAAMLDELPSDVEGILESIEVLDLRRRWPAVLLASHLINHPDESVREGFVTAAYRHVEPGGSFYVKCHSMDWLSTVEDGPLGESHGVRYFAHGVHRRGELLTMTLRYEAFGQVWTQTFTTRALARTEIEDLLARHGFGKFRWLGEKKLWLAATALGLPVQGVGSADANLANDLTAEVGARSDE